VGLTGMRSARIIAVAALASLALAACGGSSIGGGDGGSTQAADCTMNMAVNNWVGYEASAYVVGQVAADQLGCTVNYLPLKEEVSWQGFSDGTVDVIIENWGHADLAKKYIDEQGVAVDLGSQGNQGVIGWYVPPWLAAEHPDVLDYQNLNKYASEFATAETGSKGQLLDGDPAYVTNDEALVKNLGLDFQVVYAGSENALIQAFRKAEENKEWLIGYFYEPQWFLSEVPLARVSLPPYEEGCDADPAKVACDYPPYPLNKVARKAFVDSGSPAAKLVQAFTWTNDDQNTVAAMIARDGMDPEEAAQKWIDDNQDTVDAWISGTS
jgi:glycine betaine/proline transport system substrate-binding protein